ncbi:MAG: enoyl-CoA hydratase/isomerase family protein [Bryobacteraceae bacterium]|nr:enoyl-CoA hydratase/isomerase family protein [Bryobacteraceae bacterium]
MAAHEPPPSQPLETGLEGRVAWIRLNHPERRNLLDPPTVRGLLQALGRALHDRGAGAVLLLQKGDVFSAGIDYEALREPPCRDAFLSDLFRLFPLISGASKPVLAAVHGACVGAGVGLLAACHFVLAASGTKFGVTDIHAGVWPYAFYEALAAALGERRARELSLAGRAFSAADALAWGLVHEVAPPFELEDRAFQVASGIASLSPEAVRAGLEFARNPQTEEAVRRLYAALESPDFAEGLAALREKRRPRWPSWGSMP